MENETEVVRWPSSKPYQVGIRTPPRPATRSFSLLGNQTDAGFTAIADASQSANAIDTTEYFVRQLYVDFLGGEPDQGGFDFWSAQINQCNGDAACLNQRRINVSAAFYLSIEFQETGYMVERLYKVAYGDADGSSTLGSTHQLAVPVVRFRVPIRHSAD